MEKASPSTNTVFNRLSPVESEDDHDQHCAGHFEPLSQYSRMINCDNKTSLHDSRNFSIPFINFKIEVSNGSSPIKRSLKRRLDDSCLDVTCETPPKKPSNPKTVSPDHGCFIDSCTPLPIKDRAFPSTAVRSQNSEEATTSHCVKFGSKRSESLSEKVRLNLSPDFDLDVEDILCLSPIENDLNSPTGFPDLVGKCPSSNWVQNEPVMSPNPTPGQGMGEGAVKQEGRGEELKKEIDVKVTNGGDEGYFSMSYIQALQAGEKPSEPRVSLLTQTTSTPLVTIVKKEVLEGEVDHKNQPAGDHSFILNGASLVPVEGAIETLEGDVGELWNIGDPKFESSVCYNAALTPSEGNEFGSLGVEGDAIQECQTTLHGEEDVDTSYETTLPLNLKVKSVVVVPNRQPSSTKSTTPPQPQDKVLSSRPVIFDSEEDWEREKGLYVSFVTSHIMEGAGQDAMTELQKLMMTCVADQRPGTNGRQWQHPSDCTRRIYQREFGNTPRISLHEWQAQNGGSHPCFAKIPKIFERS